MEGTVMDRETLPSQLNYFFPFIFAYACFNLIEPSAHVNEYAGI
jgi:hypothetical protein